MIYNITSRIKTAKTQIIELRTDGHLQGKHKINLIVFSIKQNLQNLIKFKVASQLSVEWSDGLMDKVSVSQPQVRTPHVSRP